MSSERRVRRRSVPKRETTPGSGKRLAWLTVVIVAAAWLGWQIIGNTVADTRSPERALAWRSDHAPSLVALAEEQLVEANDPEELAEATATAQRALASAPLNQAALRALALAADLSGAEGADDLMNLAGERAPREALTQIWLLDRDIRTGDFDGAVDHFDHILRSRQDLGRQMSPVAATLAASAGDDLVAKLAANPPWRAWVLEQLGLRAATEVNFEILDGLAEAGAPPTGKEVRPFLDRLVSDGDAVLAYLTWLHFRPVPEPGTETPYLTNGSFEQPLAGVPFDWTFDTVRGARTAIASEDNKKLLRVTFSSTRVPYRHARQLLTLPPGKYVLRGRAEVHDIDTARGLLWRLRCDGGDTVIGASEHFKGTKEWGDFEVAYEVPVQDCASQLLRLELDAQVASEEMINGEIWFDDFAIARVDTPATN